MALKLDNSLLEELGLAALPESEKQLLLRQIYEKLEMNVGMRLADQMSNEQLDDFEKFVDANDDKGAFQWLEGNFPNYKQVVNDEFEKLKNEIRSVAPQILANAPATEAGQQQPQQGQFAQPVQQSAAQNQYGSSSPAPQQPASPQERPQQAYTAQPTQQPTQQEQQYNAVPQNGHLQPQYGFGGNDQQPQPAQDASVASPGYPQPPQQNQNGQQSQ